MAKIDTKELFARGYQLKEERAGVLEAQAANREILRNLDTSGMLTEEESLELEELYPVRTRSTGDGGSEEAE